MAVDKKKKDKNGDEEKEREQVKLTLSKSNMSPLHLVTFFLSFILLNSVESCVIFSDVVRWCVYL